MPRVSKLVILASLFFMLAIALIPPHGSGNKNLLSRSFTYRRYLSKNNSEGKADIMDSIAISLSVYPHLVVFDLDQCLWSPEMYTLSDMPSTTYMGNLLTHGEGVIAVLSGYEQIRLFPAALRVLQDFYLGKYPPSMRIAAASSADTPRAVSIGRAAMCMLEVLPGVTVRQVFAKGWEMEGLKEKKEEKEDAIGESAGGQGLFEGNMQIGRTPPLSADKAETHFPRLREATGVAYDKMLFFDDCLWGDHCAKVERACAGVVTQRTPRGLQESDWVVGLRAYDRRYGADEGPQTTKS